jgi:hypothetical protein
LTISGSTVYGNECIYGKDLWTGFNGVTHATHCDIGDIYGTLATSNNVISTDPLFANPATGDFHLLYGSPCINAGSISAGGGRLDMDGEPRPFGSAMEMGADEFTDADSDHMADYWEIANFGSIAVTDGTADSDGDQLNDFGEYMHQTDPHDRDTDNDLAEDGWEVANGYDPLDRDMDGDGMWDGWEAGHMLNAFTNDAALNPDDDPMDNLSEFTADTDPWDSNSVLRLLYLGEAWGGTWIEWKGGVASWQWLEQCTNLSVAPVWHRVAGLPPPRPVTNSVVVFGTTTRSEFFRIRAERVSP